MGRPCAPQRLPCGPLPCGRPCHPRSGSTGWACRSGRASRCGTCWSCRTACRASRARTRAAARRLRGPRAVGRGAGGAQRERPGGASATRAARCARPPRAHRARPPPPGAVSRPRTHRFGTRCPPPRTCRPGRRRRRAGRAHPGSCGAPRRPAGRGSRVTDVGDRKARGSGPRGPRDLPRRAPTCFLPSSSLLPQHAIVPRPRRRALRPRPGRCRAPRPCARLRRSARLTGL
jgi:hypothetical protein